MKRSVAHWPGRRAGRRGGYVAVSTVAWWSGWPNSLLEVVDPTKARSTLALSTPHTWLGSCSSATSAGASVPHDGIASHRRCPSHCAEASVGCQAPVPCPSERGMGHARHTTHAPAAGRGGSPRSLVQRKNACCIVYALGARGTEARSADGGPGFCVCR